MTAIEPNRPDGDEHGKLLRIYLGDHLGGSAAGCRLARRLADAERDSADGSTLDALARDIAADRVALLAIIDGLGVTPNRYKQALAWIVERLGRLKLNGRVLRRSPLSTVIELEALLMGVRGKLAGWHTLREALGTAQVGQVELDHLITRADAQLETLAAVHARAARTALAPGHP